MTKKTFAHGGATFVEETFDGGQMPATGLGITEDVELTQGTVGEQQSCRRGFKDREH